MIPSDRPAIAAPTPRPPARPFRNPLGAAMHLNGTVPHGADLRHAAAGRCQTCGKVFFVFGKAKAQRRTCDACRAQTPCTGCGGTAGHHAPSCWFVRRPPRWCRGCHATLAEAPPSLRYCEGCRADACVYCGRYAGAHKPSCASAKHTRRVPLPSLGLVSEAMVLEMYVTHRERAVRLARGICGAEAEDIVQDVTVYFFTRIDTLRHVNRSLFLTAVKRAAIHRITDGWWRHMVPFSDEAFAALEKDCVRQGRARALVASPGG